MMEGWKRWTDKIDAVEVEKRDGRIKEWRDGGVEGWRGGDGGGEFLREKRKKERKKWMWGGGGGGGEGKREAGGIDSGGWSEEWRMARGVYGIVHLFACFGGSADSLF